MNDSLIRSDYKIGPKLREVSTGNKGLFSVADKAEISFFGDSSELNLKSKLRANQNDLKDHLKPITPTKTVELLFFSFMAGWEKEGGQWYQSALVGYLLIPFH